MRRASGGFRNKSSATRNIIRRPKQSQLVSSGSFSSHLGSQGSRKTMIVSLYYGGTSSNHSLYVRREKKYAVFCLFVCFVSMKAISDELYQSHLVHI